jgi:hypothetical protein
MQWTWTYTYIISILTCFSILLFIPILIYKRRVYAVKNMWIVDKMWRWYWLTLLSGIIASILAWVACDQSIKIEKAKKFNADNEDAIEYGTKTADPKAYEDVKGFWFFSFVFAIAMACCVYKFYYCF